MRCPERTGLVRKYEIYVKTYGDAVRKLSGVASGLATEERKLAWELAENARMQCDKIKAELVSHSAEHKC